MQWKLDYFDFKDNLSPKPDLCFLSYRFNKKGSFSINNKNCWRCKIPIFKGVLKDKLSINGRKIVLYDVNILR